MRLGVDLSAALGLDATVGSFEVGKMFDAVVADPLATGTVDDICLCN